MHPDPPAVDIPTWAPLAPSAPPRLVRLAVPLPHADPWSTGAALEALGSPLGQAVAHWHDAAGKLTWCAYGRLWLRRLDDALGPDGPGNGVLSAQAPGLPAEHDTIALGPAPLHVAPRAVWAQSFEAGPCGRPGPFAHLGGGEVLVPRGWLVCRHGAPHSSDTATPGAQGCCSALVQVWQTPASDAAKLRRDLATMARACQTAAHAAALGPSLRQASAVPPAADVAPALPAEDPAVAAAYAARVAAARDAVVRCELSKVVLARPRALPWRVSAGATLRALREREPACVSFAVAPAQGGHFLGATPEVLVRLQDGHVHTHALAGTASRHPEPQADAAAAQSLVGSAKDQHEHALVVQAIAQALTPLCAPMPAPPAPQILGLRGLWHLHTPIEASALPGVDAWRLAQALHPTPALGGAPRSAALAYLRRFEPWRRGLYAGPLGWTDGKGDGVFVVAIRSLWLSGATVTLFSGGGIVAESDPAAEWHETVLKQQTAARALRLAPADASPECEKEPHASG